jgi:hypothetical protein
MYPAMCEVHNEHSVAWCPSERIEEIPQARFVRRFEALLARGDKL